MSPLSFEGRVTAWAAKRVGGNITADVLNEALPAFLAARGFELESDVGATEYRQRYYGEAARRMRGHEFYRVAQARVVGPGPVG